MLLLPLVALSACVRNEFTVTFTFPDDTAFTPTARLVYYSADKQKGWLTEQTATGMEQGNSVKGITRLPTVVYVYAEAGTTPKAILWAERGDKLSVDARTKSSNTLWQATGNKPTEAVNAWRVANGNIIQARASKDINAAVARYVRENPKELSAAIILLTEYDGSLDPQGLAKLWRSLKIDEEDRTALLAALGRTEAQLAAVTPGQLRELKLRSRGDTLYTFRAGQGNDGAVLLLWSSAQQRREAVRKLRSELADTTGRRTLVLDINLTADTMGWSDMAVNDSLPAQLQRRWVRLWAPGAEQNAALQPLQLRAMPLTLLRVSPGGTVTEIKQ